jgi:hypothetical protein
MADIFALYWTRVCGISVARSGRSDCRQCFHVTHCFPQFGHHCIGNCRDDALCARKKPLSSCSKLLPVFPLLQSWRHAHMSPRHCHQGVTIAETLHHKSALFVSLVNLGVQVGAGFLSAPILSATGAVAGSLQNYETAFRPVSYWGAFALDFIFGSLAVFAYQFNMSIKSRIPQDESQAEESTETRAVHSTGSHFALALGVGILVTQPNGMWTLGNWVPYFGPATNVGFTVPETGSWTIPVLWGLLTGVVGWALQLLLWNVNGISAAQYEKRAVLRSAARETEAAKETAETEAQIRSQLESQSKLA